MGLVRIALSGELYKLRRYRIYKGLLQDYIKYFPRIPYVLSVHQRGFQVSDWEILNLNKDNYKGYLTTKQYNKIHPINGYYSKLIDDKINIKYVLSGTALSNAMPAYYFIFDEYGSIRPLMDSDCQKAVATPDDIFSLLKEKGQLALKLVTGSIGKGFYKLEYVDGKILANENELSSDSFLAFIKQLKNYVVCEYVNTNPYLAEFWPLTANTMRYLAGQVNGEWRMLSSFIRFGSKKSGVVENYNRGGILCYVDEQGRFSGGYELVKAGKKLHSKHIEYHPDTNKKLEGTIPCWSEVQRVAEGIGRLLPQTRYLGFDFVITDKNEVKLLEINSLTSLDCIQIDGSILDTENGRWFFSSIMDPA